MVFSLSLVNDLVKELVLGVLGMIRLVISVYVWLNPSPYVHDVGYLMHWRLR